jgi:cysteinyl-tRNA synthetase
MRESSSNDIRTVKKHYRTKVKELEKKIRELENEVSRLNNLLQDKKTKKIEAKKPETIPTDDNILLKIKSKIEQDNIDRELLLARLGNIRKSMPIEDLGEDCVEEF